MTTTSKGDLSALTPSQRKRYEDSAKRMIPTLLRLRFGDAESLAQKTPEAQQLASVARGARTAWEQIHATHWRTLTDTTATESARLVRSATHARRQLKSMAERYESAINSAETKLGQLKGKIEDQLRPPQHAGLATVAAELRAYVRSLEPGAVMSAVRSDPRILDAVASAPAVLSGLAPENWATARAEYLQATIPDTFEEYNDLRAAVESAITAHDALTKETRTLIDFETADALESHEA